MRMAAFAIACCIVVALAGCARPGDPSPADASETAQTAEGATESSQEPQPSNPAADAGVSQETDGQEAEMRLSIDGVELSVTWEDNQAVAELEALAGQGPLTIELANYGGFEQVGPIGACLAVDDQQITTAPGDIVLYAGDQISIFYQSNAWSYTRLGHIQGKTDAELAELLGGADVSATISVR